MRPDGFHRVLRISRDTLLGVLAGVALAEAALRFLNVLPSQFQGSHIILPRNHVYRYDHLTLRGVDPNLVHTRNSLGFRGDEPPADFSRALTIVAVGDSSTECFYLSDGRTWPELLQADLKPRWPAVWVNNAGLDGHSTFAHRMLIEEFLLQLKPKVILLMVGTSDVGHENLNAEDAKMMQPSAARRLWSAIENHSRFATFASNLARSLRAGHHAVNHSNLDVRRLRPQPMTPAMYAPEVARHQTLYVPGYKRRLTDLVELCKRNGILPVLLTQPVLFGPVRDDVTGVDMGPLEGPEGLSGEGAWAVLNRYDEATRQVAGEQQVPLIDTARELPKSTRYFYDYFHFTNAGSERLAQIIARELAPVLEKRLP